MKKTPLPKRPAQTGAASDGLGAWRVMLWLVFFATSLFFLPQCLDRYLAPRFLFLSAALLVSVFLLWKELRAQGDWRLHGFDLLLLGWYGLNIASVTWAFSWSEGVFYAQKASLLFLVYWLVRKALLRDANMVRRILRQSTMMLTWAVCGILAVQIGLAFSEHGLDNEKLYDYASAVSGNKSLAADLLFFLLVFNLLFYKDFARRGEFWLNAGMLSVLILLLQTRTVYLAVALAALVYLPVRAFVEPGFSKIFRKKILPAGLLALGLLSALVAWKGRGNSLGERLNPLTYLESASANERRFVWYKTDLLNQEHFWLGVGNGSWKFWLPSKDIGGGYRLAEQNVVFTRAHNDYLEVRAEMGIVGVFWFCALFGAAFLVAIRAMRRKDLAAGARHDLLVLIAGLLGYCTIQYFDFPRERIEFQVILAILFAWTMHLTRAGWARAPGILLGKSSALFLSMAVAVLLFNLVIGWNRIRGEIHNVRLLEAQNRGDWHTVASESARAENRFYEYTDVAIPLAWHEGIAWYQMGQFEKAAVIFEKACRMNPWSFQVINNYASALVKLHRYRQAIPLYEQALQINPRYDEGKFNLSYSYFQLGDYPGSLEWLNRVDTIAHPAVEADRVKNKATLKRQAEFRKVLQEKMK